MSNPPPKKKKDFQQFEVFHVEHFVIVKVLGFLLDINMLCISQSIRLFWSKKRKNRRKSLIYHLRVE